MRQIRMALLFIFECLQLRCFDQALICLLLRREHRAGHRFIVFVDLKPRLLALVLVCLYRSRLIRSDGV